MSSFKDYGIGAAGGAVYGLVNRWIGSRWGILGTLAAPLLAGTVIKGDSGRIISTLFGLFAGLQLLNGISLGGSTNNQNQGVM